MIVADTEKLSPGELKLRQLDKRDMVTRALAMLLLLGAILFNIASAWEVQQLIKQNRQETLAARKVNFERQDQTQAYIKCIVLLRYFSPPLTASSTKIETEAALNTCAAK